MVEAADAATAQALARKLPDRMGLAEEGMTLLTVTHEMNFAKKVSDPVVFMHAGRIHEIGPPQQLFESPQTAELKQYLSALH